MTLSFVADESVDRQIVERLRDRGFDVCSSLPTFHDLPPDEYRRRVAELIGEIEEEGRREREDDPVAGVKTVLSQNPREPPTRRAKRSARPVFHVHSREAKEGLWSELRAFIEQYRFASEALKAGRMDAIDWFPEGSWHLLYSRPRIRGAAN